MDEPNHIDQYFKNRLEGSEADVPSQSWQSLQNKLSKDAVREESATNSKTKWMLLSALFGVLLTSVGFYVYELRTENQLLSNLIQKEEALNAREQELNTRIATLEHQQKTLTTTPSTAFEKPTSQPSYPNTNQIANEQQIVQEQNPSEIIDNKKPQSRIAGVTLSTKADNANISTVHSSTIAENAVKNHVNPSKEFRITKSTSVKSNAEQLSHKQAYLIAPSNKVSENYQDKVNTQSEEQDTHEESATSLPRLSKGFDPIHEQATDNNTSEVPQQKSNIFQQQEVQNEVISQQQNSIEFGSSRLKSELPANDFANNSKIADTTMATNTPASLAQSDSTVAEKDTIAPKTEKVVDAKKAVKKKTQTGGTLMPGYSMEVFYSPEVSYRDVSYSSAPLSQAAQTYKSNDQNKFAYSGGVLFNIDFLKKFYFRTGIMYSNFGDQNKSTFELKSSDTTYSNSAVVLGGIDTSKVIPIPSFSAQSFVKTNEIQFFDSLTHATVVSQTWTSNQNPDFSYKLQIKESARNVATHIKNSINYIGIPTVIGTSISTPRFSIGVFSGVITNVLLSPSRVTAYSYTNENVVVSREIELNKLNFVYWGGVDITCKLNDKWSVRIAPSMKRFLNTIYNDENVVRQLPYSYGVQFGLKYTIRNPIK